MVLTAALIGCGSGKTATPTTPPTSPFSAASTQQWLHEFGTGTVPKNDDQADTVAGVATDPEGNVVVAGYTTGAFPGFSNPAGAPEDFVAKFDAAGNQLWLQQFGTGQGDELSAVAVDAQGNILVAGQTQGAFPGFSNGGNLAETVVEKLDSTGNKVWLRQSPVNLGAEINGLAVDSQGNIILIGESSPNADSTPNAINIFAEKLAGATGAEVWTQTYGGNQTEDTVNAVAVDSQGDAFVAGISNGPFPGTLNPYAEQPLPFIIKLNGSDGEVGWVAQSNQALPANVFYNQLATDAQGDVIADGVSNLTEQPSCLVAKFSGVTGVSMWQQNFGTGLQCVAGGVALDTDGTILVGGHSPGAFLPKFTASTDDIFLAKLSATGQPVSVQQFGTGKEASIQDRYPVAPVYIATDALNNTFVSGMTRGAFPGTSNANGAREIFLGKFGRQ